MYDASSQAKEELESFNGIIL